MSNVVLACVEIYSTVEVTERKVCTQVLNLGRYLSNDLNMTHKPLNAHDSKRSACLHIKEDTSSGEVENLEKTQPSRDISHSRSGERRHRPQSGKWLY